MLNNSIEHLGSWDSTRAQMANVFSSFQRRELVNIPNQYNMSCRIDKYRLTKVGPGKGGSLY